jgi:SPP1 family predicted phage head-tail adaptor
MTLQRSGELNRRITLQQRSATQDSFGEPTHGWQDLMTVWAGIEPLSGRELELAQQMSSEVTHRITVRYQSAFTDTRWAASLRALYKNRIFNIQAALNEDEANVRIHLLASEGLNDGE